MVDCLDDIQNPTETKSTIPVENISIFPNPADNSIIIGFLDKNFRNADAIIYTMDGKFVRKSELDSDHTSLSLNNLPSGSYIVRVLDKKGNELGSETMVKK